MRCGDEYLFLHRSERKKLDPNKLNGVDGRVEPGENYLDAVIRETQEETGYEVNVNDISLSGIVKLEGGYDEGWVMCFFKTRVGTKKISLDSETADGKLIWIHKDKVLGRNDLVDDLNYSFKEIAGPDCIFFITAKINNDQKVSDISISKIPLKL